MKVCHVVDVGSVYFDTAVKECHVVLLMFTEMLEKLNLLLARSVSVISCLYTLIEITALK